MTSRLLPRPPTHVLFDLDGTLLDTEPLYTQATQAIAGRFGGVYDWSIKRKTMGGDARFGAALVIEALGLPMSIEAYLVERDAILIELFRNAPAMPGASELVAALAKAGVGLAVATSSQRALVERKLAPHAFCSHFSVIVCGDDPGVAARKPAPDIFLVAAGMLGADPSRCLVIEDAPNGVAAARAAGMPVIALVDPNMRGEAFEGALARIDRLDEITLDALGLG